jgi:hypothetical membrane protein
VLVPVTYFGAQLVAAQFYPRYSFVAQSASELGSVRSQRPWILNTGAILTGVLTLIAATAFPPALRREHCPRIVAWLTAVAMASMAAGAIWAGTYPLPDPRHNPGIIGGGAFLLPLLFAIAVWKWRGATPLKAYLFGNLVLFLLMIPVMSGLSGIEIGPYRGALQRIAAAVLYLPVGVLSTSLLRRVSTASSLSGRRSELPSRSPGRG